MGRVCDSADYVWSSGIYVPCQNEARWKVMYEGDEDLAYECDAHYEQGPWDEREWAEHLD